MAQVLLRWPWSMVNRLLGILVASWWWQLILSPTSGLASLSSVIVVVSRLTRPTACCAAVAFLDLLCCSSVERAIAVELYPGLLDKQLSLPVLRVLGAFQ